MKQEKPAIRLYIDAPFAAGEPLALSSGQAHYVANVMRLDAGDALAVFNGRDGEWLATVETVGKKHVTVKLLRQRRLQVKSPDLWLAFAPIKSKTDDVVEKATELGVAKLLPVLTRHTVVKSVNMEKLAAHACEAAEQCERLDVPAIEECRDLPTLLKSWPKERLLLYGDESGNGVPMKILLHSLPPCGGGLGRGVNTDSHPLPDPPPSRGREKKYGVLVGPEGGFSADERALLTKQPFVKAFTMGPRILRADTAAIAALACVQSWLGDWEESPCHPALVAGSGAHNQETPQ